MSNQPTGRVLEPLQPGSGDWLRTMSASKIAAVVGLSPYESRFSLWHKMSGQVTQDDKPIFHRGHLLEPAIAAWFATQHPDFDVTTGTAYGHVDHKDFTAAPDRDLCRPEGPALLELKSSATGDGWDVREGTIPNGYYAQVQWQLACAGLDICYVAMIGPYLEFAEFVIPARTSYQDWLLDEATRFMATLPWGANPTRPDIDGDMATHETVRKLHPGIDREVKVEVPADLINYYDETKAQLENLTNSHRRAKSTLLDLMGDARFATCAGSDVLRRQPGKGGHISLYSVKAKDAA